MFRWAPQLMLLLDELPHVQVVVHSSWRHLFETDDEVRSFMPPALAARVVACTPREIGGRLESIVAYVEREGVEQWAIVDDDPRWFPKGLPGLVLCSPKTGLSRKTKIQALREALAEDKVAQFSALLDAPPAPNLGLERLLAVKPPWSR